MRIAGSEGARTAPISRPVENGTSKASGGHGAGDEGGDHDARDRKQPKPDRDATENARGELKPAVEEDERDAERQQELSAHRVERNVDPIGDRRADQHASAEKNEHAGRPDRVCEELAHEPNTEHDAEREDDVLDGHGADSAQSGDGDGKLKVRHLRRHPAS